MLSGEITIRVRYAETDRMGLLHHANYLVYFEQGRTELLRSLGHSYKDLEDQGFLLCRTRWKSATAGRPTSTTCSPCGRRWSAPPGSASTTATRCCATASWWPRGRPLWRAWTGRAGRRGCRNSCDNHDDGGIRS